MVTLVLEGLIDQVSSTARYEAGFTDFTLQLLPSVKDSAENGSDVPDKYIRPWHWTIGDNTEWLLLSAPYAGGNMQVVGTADLKVRIPPAQSGDFQKWVTQIDDKNPDNWQPQDDTHPNGMMLVAPRRPTVANDPITKETLSHSWGAWLNTLQTLGNSTSQQLNLNRFFRVADALILGKEWVVALPEFKFTTGGETFILSFDATRDAATVGDIALSGTKKGQPDKAYAKINCKCVGDNGHSYDINILLELRRNYSDIDGTKSVIDPATLRVTLSQNNKPLAYSTEWLTTLPEKVAVVGNIPALILEVARTNSKSLDDLRRKIVDKTVFRRGLLATLFSIAHAGSFPEAGKSTGDSQICLAKALATIASNDIATNLTNADKSAKRKALATIPAEFLDKLIESQKALRLSLPQPSPEGNAWPNLLKGVLKYSPVWPALSVGQSLIDNIDNELLALRPTLDMDISDLRIAAHALTSGTMSRESVVASIEDKFANIPDQTQRAKLIAKFDDLPAVTNIGVAVALTQWLNAYPAVVPPDGNYNPLENALELLVRMAKILNGGPGRLTLLDTLGIIGPDRWKAISDCTTIDIGSELVNITGRLPEQLSAAALNYLPNDFVALKGLLKESVERLVYQPDTTKPNDWAGVLPQDDASLAYGDPTTHAATSGLSIPVDRPGAPAGDGDFHRRLSGMVLYVNECTDPTNQKFYCANKCSLDFYKDRNAAAGNDTIMPDYSEPEFLLPYRISAIAGQRMPVIHYSGSYISGRTRGEWKKDLLQTKQKPETQALLPPSIVRGEPRISEDLNVPPPLYFGGTYRFAVWATNFNGAYAPDIVTDWPDTPKNPITFAELQNKNVPNTSLLQLKYLRRTRVTAPEFVNWGKYNKFNKTYYELKPGALASEDPQLVDPVFPPTPPAALKPLASELVKDFPSLANSVQTVSLLPQDWFKDGNAPDGRSSFTFHIGRPKVDDATYLAWFLSAWTRADATRAIDNVWKSTYQTLAAITRTVEDNGSDTISRRTSFEDPAVSHLQLSVTTLAIEGQLIKDEPKMLDAPIELNRTGDAIVQAGLAPGIQLGGNQCHGVPLNVICNGTEDANYRVKPTFDGQGVTVVIPKGFVVQITCINLVKTDEFFADDGKSHRFIAQTDFASNLKPDESPKPYGSTGFAQFGIHSFVVEAASLIKPENIDLRTALVPELIGETVTASIKPPADGPIKNNFRLISEVAVERQEWNWNGRPVDTQIEIDGRSIAINRSGSLWGATADQSTREDWDVLGFMTRSSDDVMPRRANMIGGNPVKVFEENVRHDSRARYYRFRARAWSRYRAWLDDHAVAGMLKTDPQPKNDLKTIFRNPIATEHNDGDQVEYWSRLLVKARPTQKLPPPVLRGLLPLTAAAPGRNSAGWLAVFEGDWYGRDSAAGIAADLEVTIVDAVRIGNSAPEISYDPIHSISSLNDKSPGNALEHKGASSYSFDFEGSAKLIDATAFVIETDNDVPMGSFVKMRFRRTVLPDAFEAANGADAEQYASEYTTGFWARALPDSDSVWYASSTGDTPKRIRVDHANFQAKQGGDGKYSFCLKDNPVYLLSEDAAYFAIDAKTNWTESTKRPKARYKLIIAPFLEVKDAAGKTSLRNLKEIKYDGAYVDFANQRVQCTSGSFDLSDLPSGKPNVQLFIAEVEYQQDINFENESDFSNGKFWRNVLRITPGEDPMNRKNQQYRIHRLIGPIKVSNS